MLQVDFHCHSQASVHAMNSIEELLHRAEVNGMDAIAITDHCPNVDNTAWLINKYGVNIDPDDYIRASDIHYFRTFVSRYFPPDDCKVKLFKGIECNIQESGDPVADIPMSVVDKFDIVIASVHSLPHLMATTDNLKITDRVLEAMDEPFDILGHPVQRVYALHSDEVLKKAASCGKTIELNNSVLNLKKGKQEDVIRLIKQAKKYECRISLGSDAHTSSELGDDRCIREILNLSDFPEELIVNRNLGAAIAFVDERKQVRKEFKKQR